MNNYSELLKNLKRAYDTKALERERNGLSIWPWKAEERERFLSEIKRAGKQRFLEIGCGTGRDALFFQSKGFDVVCTDLSPRNIALCRNKGLNAHVMDFLHLDFPPSSFDAVFALNCLLHVPRELLRQTLRNIQRLLHPTGRFYLGIYGGHDREGVLDDDDYEPKRFFVFYTDIHIIQIVNEIFDVVYFRRVEFESDSLIHFQSMILKPKIEHID